MALRDFRRKGDSTSNIIIFITMIIVGLIVITWYMQSVRPTRQIIGSVVDDIDGMGRHIANACTVSTYKGSFQPSTQNGQFITNATHYCVVTDVFGSCEPAVCELEPSVIQFGLGVIVKVLRDDDGIVHFDSPGIAQLPPGAAGGGNAPVVNAPSCVEEACAASDPSMTNCLLPSCVNNVCVQDAASRSYGTPCKDDVGVDGVCDGTGFCIVPTCSDPRDNATVCAGWACDAKRDECNVLRSCGECSDSEMCFEGSCDTFMIELAQDKRLTLDGGHEDYSANPPSTTRGFDRPLTVLSGASRLVTGQAMVPYGCPGGTGCTRSYAVAFSLDDPMNPVADDAVSINRMTGEYACHGANLYSSFAASPDLSYQVATFNNVCGVTAAVIPDSSSGVRLFERDYDIANNKVGSEKVTYGVAENGSDAYAVLNEGIIRLTGITPKANAPRGSTRRCVMEEEAEDVSYIVCWRELFNRAPWPASAPRLGMGQKAVFGGNIIHLACTSTTHFGTCVAPDHLALYTLERPTSLQNITLPPELMPPASGSSGTYVYGKTLSQGRFVVIGEVAVPGTSQHQVQVFKLVGTGVNAHLENVTGVVSLPGYGSTGTLVSIDGEVVLIDASKDAAYNSSIHAYLLRELVDMPLSPHDIFYNPPAFANLEGLRTDVTNSIASHNKDADAYLYVLKDAPSGIEHRVWKLARKE